MPLTYFINSAIPLNCTHFIGIGGIGMSALARLLLHKGHQIQGSNNGNNSQTQVLSHEGARIFNDHRDTNLGHDVTCVVVSSAIDRNNPEWQEAHNRGLPVIHRSELLKTLVKDSQVIAISGSHGKTTTTSLMGHLLIKAGKDPLVMAGGIMQGYQTNVHTGKSSLAVIEADESDGSHLNFSSLIGALITNISPEHLSHYGSWEKLVQSFEDFANMAHTSVLCGDDKGVQLLKEERSNNQRIFYGVSDSCQVRAQNIRPHDNGMVFNVSGALGPWKDVELKLWGHHNVLNALGVITMAKSLPIPIENEDIRQALASFQGVDRRMTHKGWLQNQVLILDDYAHHPREIETVLYTLRQRGYKRIACLCQPHRYTRLRDSFASFEECFEQADHVFLFPVYSSGEEEIADTHSEKLAQKLMARGKSTNLYGPWAESLEELKLALIQGGFDVALCVGAGDITHLASALAQQDLKKVAGF